MAALRITIGTCGLFALCIASVAAQTARGATPTPRAGASTEIVGGTPAERRLARLTALRVGPMTLRRIVFRAPSRLEVVSARPRSTALSVRITWEQLLYVGTYFALTARYQHTSVATAVTSDSELTPRWVPAYDLWSSLPRATAVAAEKRILVDAATARGARVEELRVAATPARALAITLRVDDPAAFLRHRAASFLELLDRPHVRLLGYYLGLEDAGGRLVWADSRLPNEGSVYATPRLDGCNPVAHSVAIGVVTAPCPAP